MSTGPGLGHASAQGLGPGQAQDSSGGSGSGSGGVTTVRDLSTTTGDSTSAREGVVQRDTDRQSLVDQYERRS